MLVNEVKRKFKLNEIQQKTFENKGKKKEKIGGKIYVFAKNRQISFS